MNIETFDGDQWDAGNMSMQPAELRGLGTNAQFNAFVQLLGKALLALFFPFERAQLQRGMGSAWACECFAVSGGQKQYYMYFIFFAIQPIL